MSTIDDIVAGRLNKPAAPSFKLLEHDGWQALVSIREDEDSDTRWEVEVCIPCDEVDVTLKFGAPNEEVARKLFDGFDEPERVISGTIKTALGEVH